MEALELDCLLGHEHGATSLLTGFTGTTGACALIAPEEQLFLTDFRYVDQAGEQVHDYETLEIGRDMLAGGLAQRLRGRSGFDDGHMSVATPQSSAGRPARASSSCPPELRVEDLRAVKDETEVAAMRAAAEIANDATSGCGDGPRGAHGARRGRVAARFMEDRGAEGPSFPPIVASGGARCASARRAAWRRDPARHARRGRHGREGRRLLLGLQRLPAS